MQNRVKNFLIITGVSMVLLVFIEILCSTVLSLMGDTHERGFLIDRIFFDKLRYETIQKMQFNEVDPLLGYSKTDNQLEELGYKIEHGTVVFKTSDDTANGLHILITGGSTSDMSLSSGRWPVHFCHILKEHGIKAKVYAGAVGGFNTGQELLKLIRDGLELKPAIHISYSGANDLTGASYVSNYEDNFFRNDIRRSHTFFLMPNTLCLINSFLNKRHSEIIYYQNKEMSPDQFWSKNMRAMYGISLGNQYSFAGFLQPVLGSGKYKQTILCNKSAIARQKKYYPFLQKVVAQNPNFLTDLSCIFDTCTGTVFCDNCHINPKYERIVAENIFEVLVRKNAFGIESGLWNNR